MTAMMGQSGKRILTIALLVPLVLLPATATRAMADAAPAGLVTTIVTDPLTGVALGGFDAVSYFTGDEPRPGVPDFEASWGGVVWYFANAANRDVFTRDPSVYAPAFGGHCVTSLSRGFLSDGNPRLYLIRDGRLLLFYSTANRDAFQLSEEAALEAARRNWKRLEPGLIGPEQAAPALMAW